MIPPPYQHLGSCIGRVSPRSLFCEAHLPTLAIIGLTPCFRSQWPAQLWEMEAMLATRSVLIVEDDEFIRRYVEGTVGG